MTEPQSAAKLYENDLQLKKAFKEYCDKLQIKKWAVESALKSSAVDVVTMAERIYAFVSGEDAQLEGGTLDSK